MMTPIADETTAIAKNIWNIFHETFNKYETISNIPIS